MTGYLGDIHDRSASITIEGNINTSQNITLTASALRDIHISDSNEDPLNTETLSNAVIQMRNATINAAKFEVLASSDGIVITQNTIDNAKNKISDQVYAKIEESCQIAANQLTVRASRGTDYQATGRDAYNHISGDTQAWVKDSSITSSGDVSITAEDTINMSAESKELTLDLSTITSESTISASSARNYLSGNVDAHLINSTLTVTGENTVSISAKRNTQIKSVAKTDHLTATSGLASGYSINLEGTYSSNILTGHTKATIDSSDVNAPDSNIQVIAKETSAVDAKSSIAASSDVNSSLYQGFSSTVGTSIAFNALGWEPENAGMQTVDALANTSFATSSPMDVNAYILDSTVEADELEIKATLETKLNSTISNAATTKASSSFGSSGMSTSGILSSNMLNSTVKAYIDNTSDTKTITTNKALTITATDMSEIYSNSKIVSSSIITSDGGVSVLDDYLPIDTDYKTSDGVTTINFGDRVWLSEDYAIGGNPETVYIYMGTQDSIDLSAEDYSNKDLWKEIPETQMLPDGFNLNSASSASIGGMVVRNDVRGDVLAYINNSTITSGDLTIGAKESAIISAIADSTAESSGGSSFGSGLSLAVNGIIATNLILSKANAYINNSNITTTGDLLIDTQNLSTITATNTSITTSGDTSVGATLAFNTIGWKSQNILYNTIDALIGTDIGDEQPAEVKAYITDSTLTAGGNISINADQKSTITANVSNDSTSAASALVDASGIAVSAILSSNMVSTTAKAYIENTDSQKQINADGNITVNAKDDAEIKATNNMKAISTTTNDGGASIVSGLLDSVDREYDYTSKSGVQNISTNDIVRIASDHSGSAAKNGLYVYIGQNKDIDLGSEDYTNKSSWKRFFNSSISDFLPEIGNVTSSDSMAFGGLVVRNDIRTGAQSYIHNSHITASGNIHVSADESATIVATDESLVSSSGGSSFGEGVSMAINAMIATNLVLSSADAHIKNSDISTTNSANIIVDAQNTSAIDASITSSTISGDMAVGVVLAFNSIGWESQNILFKTIDALIGTDIGNEALSQTTAYIENTSINANGSISVTANNFA
jgi:hypothetical protein